MKFINFDNYVKKIMMNILIKTILNLNIHQILLLLELQDVVKPIYYLIF